MCQRLGDEQSFFSMKALGININCQQTSKEGKARAAPAGTLQRARCGYQANKNGGATGYCCHQLKPDNSHAKKTGRFNLLTTVPFAPTLRLAHVQDACSKGSEREQMSRHGAMLPPALARFVLVQTSSYLHSAIRAT